MTNPRLDAFDGLLRRHSNEMAERLGLSHSVNVAVPVELLEAIAQRVADVLRAPAQDDDRWMELKTASAYLDCKPSRLYEFVSRGRIPHERDGRRILFRRSELDAWVRNGGAKRLGK